MFWEMLGEWGFLVHDNPQSSPVPSSIIYIYLHIYMCIYIYIYINQQTGAKNYGSIATLLKMCLHAARCCESVWPCHIATAGFEGTRTLEECSPLNKFMHWMQRKSIWLVVGGLIPSNLDHLDEQS